MIGRTTLVGLNQPLRQHLTSIQTLWAFISWIWRRTTSLRKTSPNSLQMDLHLCTLGKNIVATTDIQKAQNFAVRFGSVVVEDSKAMTGSLHSKSSVGGMV